MPIELLGTAKAKPGGRYYLDTSAIFALAAPHAKAAKQAVRALEEQRAQAATDFLKAAVAAGAAVRTSVLAFEEVAAVSRRRGRDLFARQAGHNGWETAKTSADAESVDANAKAAMLTWLTWAVTGFRVVGGAVEQPETPADETTIRAERLRKLHRKLLSTYSAIDPMDALHIATGISLGCNDFVSFDKGWETVAEITVYQ
jgi:predicted nucleic acid-binding protein